MSEKVKKTDEEWRQLLTPEQYRVTRTKGLIFGFQRYTTNVLPYLQVECQI